MEAWPLGVDRPGSGVSVGGCSMSELGARPEPRSAAPLGVVPAAGVARCRRASRARLLRGRPDVGRVCDGVAAAATDWPFPADHGPSYRIDAAVAASRPDRLELSDTSRMP